MSNNCNILSFYENTTKLCLRTITCLPGMRRQMMDGRMSNRVSCDKCDTDKEFKDASEDRHTGEERWVVPWGRTAQRSRTM